jgi:hypothetical protein
MSEPDVKSPFLTILLEISECVKRIEIISTQIHASVSGIKPEATHYDPLSNSLKKEVKNYPYKVNGLSYDTRHRIQTLAIDRKTSLTYELKQLICDFAKRPKDHEERDVSSTIHYLSQESYGVVPAEFSFRFKTKSLVDACSAENRRNLRTYIEYRVKDVSIYQPKPKPKPEDVLTNSIESEQADHG